VKETHTGSNPVLTSAQFLESFGDFAPCISADTKLKTMGGYGQVTGVYTGLSCVLVRVQCGVNSGSNPVLTTILNNVAKC
jgi:hypothetical protein